MRQPRLVARAFGSSLQTLALDDEQAPAECVIALLLPREAVAYIGGGPNRPASRRLICLGTLPEVLRTAHLTAHLRAR
jgi:hypothetical protein